MVDWKSFSNLLGRCLEPGLQYHFLASVPFVAVFGLIPASIYLHAGENWEFSPSLVGQLAEIGVVALLATGGVIRVVAILSKRAAESAALALFCLGSFLLLAHVYAPIAIGPLDGSEVVSEEPLSYTFLEAGLLAALLASFVFLRRGHGLKTMSLFAAGLWLIGLGYLTVMGWQGGQRAAATPLPSFSSGSHAACTGNGNVYHLVLDTLQTDAFLTVVDRDKWRDEFSGFDLFRNNIANYLVTANSRASYLTGTFFHRGSIRDWRKLVSKSGLLPALSANNYKIAMYAPFRQWNYDNADFFFSNDDAYEKEVGIPQSQFYEFLSIWLASLAPNALTNEAIGLADPLAKHLFTGLMFTTRGQLESKGGNVEALLTKSGFHAYASALLMHQITRDERLRGPRCHYVHAHALLPHHPFVLDGHCRYVGIPGKGSRQVQETRAYLEQTQCAVARVVAFLRELKRLKRYDEATILIHADTGNWVALNETARVKGTILGGPGGQYLAFAQALLMVKRPQAEGALRVLDAPTQLVDVYPTVLDILDLAPASGKTHGVSIYSTRSKQREARFSLDPEKPHGPNLVDVRIDKPQSLRNSHLTVLGRTTDPAIWRKDVE